MISKTRLDRKIKRKRNPDLVETLFITKKNAKWYDLCHRLTASRRTMQKMNLDEIDEKTKEGDTVVVAGKVLGAGNVSKKIRVCALSFSASAREKLKEKKCEIVEIKEEEKKNKNAQGVLFLK